MTDQYNDRYARIAAMRLPDKDQTTARMFLSDTAVAPATTGAPTATEIEAALGEYVNGTVYYTGTDNAGDPPRYTYQIDRNGTATPVSVPFNDAPHAASGTLVRRLISHPGPYRGQVQAPSSAPRHLLLDNGQTARLVELQLRIRVDDGNDHIVWSFSAADLNGFATGTSMQLPSSEDPHRGWVELSWQRSNSMISWIVDEYKAVFPGGGWTSRGSWYKATVAPAIAIYAVD